MVLILTSFYYHPRIWVGNCFQSCLSVCVCVCCLSVCPPVCLSVYMPVMAITFEPLHIENFWYTDTSLPYLGQGHWFKVILEKKYNFTYFNMLILCMLLQIIHKVKVTNQGQSRISTSL